MRESLILRLGRTPQSSAEWMVRAAPGESGAAPEPLRGSLAEALEQAHGRRLVVVVPAEDVLLTEVDLAVRQPSRLLQAIPYALEEHLAQDVDELHFACGPRQPSGHTPVAVVDKRLMDRWLEPFVEAGLQPEVLVPETLALPATEARPAVLLDEDCCTVRTAAYSGFVCERDTVGTLLALARGAAGDDEEDGDTGVDLIQIAGQDKTLPNDVGLARTQTVQLPVEAMLAAPEVRLNLLSGAYAPRRETDKWLRAFRVPAAVAASWLLLATLSMGISNASLSGEVDRLYAEAEGAFTSAFPHVTRIVDLRSQAEIEMRTLAGGGSQTGFLYLLAESGKAIAAVEDLSLEGVQYRDNSLYLNLTGTDLQALDVLRGKFDENPALGLEVQSAQAGSDGVQIRLKVDSV